MSEAQTRPRRDAPQFCSPQSRSPQWPIDLVAYALFADVGLQGLLETARVVRQTQAVLPNEFPFLALIYAWLPVLQGTHIALALGCAAAAAWLWRRGDMGGGWAAALGLGAAATSFYAYALPVPVLALVAFRIVERRRALETGAHLVGPARALSRRLERLAPRSALRALLDVALLGAVVGVSVSLLEGLLYTSRFMGELFTRGDFVRFQTYAAANAVVYCWVRGAIAVGVVFCFSGLVRTLVRARWVRPASVPALYCGLFSVAAWGMALRLILHVFGEEIAVVGLLPQLYAQAVLLAALSTAIALRNLTTVMADGGSAYEALPSLRADLFACVSAVVSPALTPLAAARGWLRGALGRPASPAGRGFHFTGAVVTLAVLGAVLLVVNYPALHDYSSVVVHVYSTVVVMIVFAIACLLAHLWRPEVMLRARLGAAVCGVGAACVGGALWSGAAQANTGVILHEYAVINKVFTEQIADIAYLRQSEMGLREAHHPELVFHPPGYEVLPENPGVAVPEGAPPPVIVILVDALRADRLGVYGYDRETSPNLDRLAKDAVVFERAYSGSTATSCGVRSMFAGAYATRYMLEPDLPTFYTKDLIDCGYRDFLVSVWDTDYNGISLRSFEHSLQSLTPEERAGVKLRPFEHRDDHEMALDAVNQLSAMQLASLERPTDERGWFFYMHLTATHFPWGERPLGRDFGTRPEDLYDHSVSYSDAAIGILLDWLRAAGLYDEAVIAVMADHGTGLMEHGRYAGFFCYEEQIRVPLLIKMPGVQARRVSEPVSLIDVGPTLVNLTRRGEPNRFHGVSLLPLMTGQQERTGRQVLFNLCAFNDAYAVIYKERWKLVYHRHEGYRQLFDLATDPREQRNVVAQHPDLDANLQGLLAAFLWEGRHTYANPYHFRDFVFDDGHGHRHAGAPTSTPADETTAADE